MLRIERNKNDVRKIKIYAFTIVFVATASLGWCQQDKRIALTFDDGPRPAVLQNLLPLLSRFHVPATFFVIGSIAQSNEKWLLEEHRLGHEIENHSFGHENLKKTFLKHGPNAIRLSIEKTARIITEIIGKKPRFFRPPFWEITKDIENFIRSSHTVMKLGRPDVNTKDYEDAANHRTPAVLTARVKWLIAQRERKKIFHHVLVFHELPITIEALKELIPYFKKEGYTFSRLDGLLTR